MPHTKQQPQDLYYAVRGNSGAPLVFIHGAGDSHLLWNGQLAALSDVARTYAPDLPGHGKSAGAGRDTIADYADAVRGFMDELGVERAVFVGSSMGGAIAQSIAIESPARVMGLVLVGTGAKLRVTSHFLDGLQNDFEATARELVEMYYPSSDSTPPDVTMALKEKSLAQLIKTGSAVTYGDFAACDAFDERMRLHLVERPTLVICGENDRMTPPSYSRFIAQVITDARLEIIAGAGHMVMLEQPQEFGRIVREWLKTV